MVGLCPVGSTPSLAHCEVRFLGNHCCTVAASEFWLSSRALYVCSDDVGYPVLALRSRLVLLSAVHPPRVAGRNSTRPLLLYV